MRIDVFACWMIAALLLPCAAVAQTPDLTFESQQIQGYLIEADLDGNGLQQVAWVNFASELVVLDETGSILINPDSGLGYIAPLDALDYDGDGTDNLLVVTTSDVYDFTLGRPLLFDYGFVAASIGDLDGDGDEDVVDQEGVLLAGPDGFARSTPIEGMDACDPCLGFPVRDLDGDGAKDLVLSVWIRGTDPYSAYGNYTAGLLLLLTSDLGDGNTWSPRWSWRQERDDREYITGVSVVAADTDGDQVDELVVLSAVKGAEALEHGVVTVLGDLLAEAPRPLASQFYDVPSLRPTLHNLGDLDGDGDDELLFNGESDSGWLRIIDAEPVDDALFDELAPPLVFDLPEDTNSDPNDGCCEALVTSVTSVVTDLDGDGALDVVAAYDWLGEGGNVSVWYGSSVQLALIGAAGGGEPAQEPPRSCGCASANLGGASIAIGLAAAFRRRRRPRA